ncbi:HD-GYP domain-containing protein [Geobacter sp. AOG1]|uniref:HD-GYP domain-containing protein n=1 Tax=Geobacter sp. AOG1 TaxID=1566346 RepID=UPI001CC7B5D9|nr:HD domain-containing phosphohydrolase [Geobacter sp. AOG1]GFE57304.1 HD family phosphohydrolase [Geobacter sp. AOG1]
MSGDRRTNLQSCIRHLMTAVSNASLYNLEHQQVARLCETALSDLLGAMGDGEEVALLLVDEELVFADSPLDSNMYVNRFSRALKSRGVGHLRLLRGVTHQELKLLVGCLSRQMGAGGGVRSTDHVRFGRLEVLTASPFADSATTWDEVGERPVPSLEEIPAEEVARFMDIYQGVRRHRKLHVVGISEIVAGFVDAFQQVGNPFLALAPLRALDEYTFTHSTNVCILNLGQAMALGIDGPLLHDIGIAAMLHDIGKLFIPEEILKKAGQLEDDEWKLVREHPLKGAQYLLDTPGVPRLAVVTAFEHHMRFNGTGYPAVTPGWRQNLCSQMTTVSDCFDALRSNRAYRGALEYDEISDIMLGQAGNELHPLLTRNFLKVLRRLTGAQTNPANPSRQEGAPR